MNIGIVVYSETSNTKGVAKILKQKIEAYGHKARIEHIRADKKRKHLEIAPSTHPYDRLYFAAPVHAFTLAQPMKKYLRDLPDLPEVPVGVFVTQQFRHKIFGGMQALRYMKRMLKKRGATITASGIVHWTHPGRDRIIDEITDELLK